MHNTLVETCLGYGGSHLLRTLTVNLSRSNGYRQRIVWNSRAFPSDMICARSPRTRGFVSFSDLLVWGAVFATFYGKLACFYAVFP